jgi:hypothetical protein
VKSISENTWSGKSPYNRYFDFIAEKADRYSILLKCIEKLNLNPTIISVAGNRHIFIFPQGKKSLRASGGVFPFRNMSPYLLCAHYDRVEGSLGANDNSIAVFHLLNTASILTKSGIGQWIILFTDKEELNSDEGLEMQGSFTLAVKLKDWGLEKARIYNFDACGCGSVLILSTTTDDILKDNETPNIKNIKMKIRFLRDHALETANFLRFEKVLLAPTPFSDDAGFLRAGFAAQTVTILPVKEAVLYEALLRSRSDFTNIIISGKVKEPVEKRNLPETWRSLNSSLDKPARLTPEYFEQTVNFIVGLCKKS